MMGTEGVMGGSRQVSLVRDWAVTNHVRKEGIQQKEFWDQWGWVKQGAGTGE